MNSRDIRNSYLKFFENLDHRVVESSPVVPQGDPTLLFTNAGMNQFKDLLLGNEIRDYKRAVSVQKCIRAGGKHNDLDEVGKDGRHLTFFEMLGNWSFGDYYKREAITWAWDYCLNVLSLDPTRLFVTVHDNDDESHAIWVDEIKVPPKHLLKLGDADNFWSMGPTGPCGPCTEIHIDLHPDLGEIDFVAGGYDPDRVIEIWNLVFMEFNRDEDGTLDPLPMKSVDTGMGLDRVTMVKENVHNVFHTDLFRPIFDGTAKLLDIAITDWPTFYKRADFTDFAVIADHTRTVTFALVDGAQFSNDGRGYVVRRILRRAVRHGRKIGFTGPFLYQVAMSVVEAYGDIYPELRDMGARAAELIRLEEERFFRNIDRGIELFDISAHEALSAGKAELSGERVFQLHATYGFPPDLTEIMAEERGLKIDMNAYERLWREHQETSKAKDVYADAAGVGDWQTIVEGPSSHFVGYTQTESTTRVMKFRHVDQKRYELLLEDTPFYAESGGQVGDTGRITIGDVLFEVTDTQKAPIGIVHSANLVAGSATAASLVGPARAEVDVHNRKLIQSNHTATHLLHAALRGIVSDTIFQAGSLVSPEKLRFDFSYGTPLTPTQIEAIEIQVNRQIREAHVVNAHFDVPRDYAVNELGAMAIFGEKYGDAVRVIEIPGESVELCGGTHVSNTADINLFRITSEAGVAAGIRRIEAITNETAFQSFLNDRDRLREVANVLKADVHNVIDRAKHLVEEKSHLERQFDKLSHRLAKADSQAILAQAIDVNGVSVISKTIQVDTREQMLTYADMLRGKLTDGVVLLAAEIDEKAALVCVVTDSAFKTHKLQAGDLVNKAAHFVDGRGGGRPTLAQAGGNNPAGIADAVARFPEFVRELLG